MKKKTQEVNITEMIEPVALSLVGMPANQVSFKILRSDDAHDVTNAGRDDGAAILLDVAPAPAKALRSRKKRSDSPLLELEFPDGFTEEQVNEYIATYGLQDYAVESMNGKYVLRRDKNVSRGSAISVTLLKGVKAYIGRSAPPPEANAGIKLGFLEFAVDYFTSPEEVNDWIVRNKVDFPKNTLETTDNAIIAKRCEWSEETEVRRVKVDDGVVAVIARSDIQDIADVPYTMSLGIQEAAYGNYGWGQLDFGALLADVKFSEAAEEATVLLHSVVNQILLYSGLPVAMRKDLLQRAVEQFTTYTSSLLDALPTQMVAATRSQLNREKYMSEEKKEEVVAVVSEVVVAEVVVAEVVAPVSREDIAALVAAAVEAALAKRADAEKKQVVAEVAPVAAPVDQVVEVLRSVKEAVEAVGTRVANLEGKTVVRSGNEDGAASRATDPFKGMFSAR